MRQIWSYLVVVLWVCVTSARILDYPGNRDGLQDNLFSTLKKEKALTPPFESGLIIDFRGYHRNSNGLKIKEVNPKDSPSFFDEIINDIIKENKHLNEYNIIPFSKEDVVQLVNSDICKNMCANNVKKTPCNCEEENLK